MGAMLARLDPKGVEIMSQPHVLDSCLDQYRVTSAGSFGEPQRWRSAMVVGPRQKSCLGEKWPKRLRLPARESTHEHSAGS